MEIPAGYLNMHSNENGEYMTFADHLQRVQELTEHLKVEVGADPKPWDEYMKAHGIEEYQTQEIAQLKQRVQELEDALREVVEKADAAKPFLMAGMELSVPAGYRCVSQEFIDALDKARRALEGSK